MTETAAGPISEDETRALLEQARHGDFRAREQLAQSHQRLIGSIVQRFLGSGREREDLFQVGCIGLLKAIDRFDPDYGVRFSTYAVPLIMGEIRRFLRDDTPVSVSRGLKELYLLLERKRRELTAEWGREPELWQLAEACGSTPQQILAAREAARPPLSINEARPGSGEENGPGWERLSIRDGEGGPDRIEERLDLDCSLSALTPRLRFIIEQRYFRERTQKEVAVLLGVSQVQVSRLEHRALSELRRIMSA
ncbi:MAG: sigma-70 family RNA polymerase sigma factor [Firmicutes bacterium]|nr:sigma-70 family RNA polymerase sigma factor [Bacillota bacterium]